eukprot:XP_001707015.1 Hypothetical protein GL50803_1640 [Giardia lamblia ATCC 50803]
MADQLLKLISSDYQLNITLQTVIYSNLSATKSCSS